MAGKDLKDREQILVAARELNRAGMEIVLISLGAKGMLLIPQRGEYFAVPPDEVKNIVGGAGDSAVAGFIFGLINGKDLKRSLAHWVAAGKATTLRQGTALCERADLESILKDVKLEIISEKWQ